MPPILVCILQRTFDGVYAGRVNAVLCLGVAEACDLFFKAAETRLDTLGDRSVCAPGIRRGQGGDLRVQPFDLAIHAVDQPFDLRGDICQTRLQSRLLVLHLAKRGLLWGIGFCRRQQAGRPDRQAKGPERDQRHEGQRDPAGAAAAFGGPVFRRYLLVRIGRLILGIDRVGMAWTLVHVLPLTRSPAAVLMCAASSHPPAMTRARHFNRWASSGCSAA